MSIHCLKMFNSSLPRHHPPWPLHNRVDRCRQNNNKPRLMTLSDSFVENESASLLAKHCLLPRIIDHLPPSYRPRHTMTRSRLDPRQRNILRTCLVKNKHAKTNHPLLPCLLPLLLLSPRPLLHQHRPSPSKASVDPNCIMIRSWKQQNKSHMRSQVRLLP